MTRIDGNMRSCLWVIIIFILAIALAILIESTGEASHLDEDTVLLARMITQEAGAEPYLGKVAVGWVARNRVESSVSWWGTTYRTVILKPYQFYIHERYTQEAYTIAEMVIGGRIEDPMDGATHFHMDYINPPWADELTYLGQTGNHKFYK